MTQTQPQPSSPAVPTLPAVVPPAAPIAPITGRATVLPAIFSGESRAAIERTDEYFRVALSNDSTRANYRRAVTAFCHWVSARNITRLRDIQAVDVADFLDERRTKVSIPMVITDLSAMRGWLEYLTRGGLLPFNPAASVKAPRYKRTEGKTPGMNAGEASQLLASIDGQAVKDKRDRAIVGLMLYSGCRASAVSAMKVDDFYQTGARFMINLHEKGGQDRTMVLHHQAAEYLLEWVAAAGIAGEPKSPLFRTMPKRVKLQEKPFTENAIGIKNMLVLVKTRCEKAGLGDRFTNHSFRVTAITNMLENGATIEQAQRLAGHADARTTGLYDRRSRAVTTEIVETINYSSSRPAARAAQP